MKEVEKFNPEYFDFEVFYETGIETPTWIFSIGDGYEDWNYIISLPKKSSKIGGYNETDIWCVEKITNEDRTVQVYEGLIPSRNFAQELFVNLKMHYLPYVRRELNLDSILNKN